MLRIMIVDDEEISVKRLKRILSESGRLRSCHTFLDPSEAYEFAKANPVDVAFLDISMPKIDGMALSGLLQALDASIDVVFVTGYDEYAVQAFDMSAMDYLLKPVTEKRMMQTLDKIRKRYRSARNEPAITVHLFNGLNIYLGDRQEPLKFRSPKTEELFAFLIWKGTVSREEIVDTLWSELEPEKAWSNLNTTLYYIRKAISESGAEGFVQSGKDEIRIRRTDMYCDMYEFEQLLKQIRLAPADSAELYTQAESVYSGALLKGKSYEWATGKAQRLESDYIELLEAAADHHMKQNQPQRSLYYLNEILKLDPIREDIHYRVIRLLAELGRSIEAIRQYRMMEEMLLQELGIAPDAEIADFVMKLR